MPLHTRAVFIFFVTLVVMGCKTSSVPTTMEEPEGSVASTSSGSDQPLLSKLKPAAKQISRIIVRDAEDELIATLQRDKGVLRSLHGFALAGYKSVPNQLANQVSILYTDGSQETFYFDFGKKRPGYNLNSMTVYEGKVRPLVATNARNHPEEKFVPLVED